MTSQTHRQPRLIIFLILLMVLSSACSSDKPVETITPLPLEPTAAPPTATPLPAPLPPALLESDPLPGAEIPLSSTITLRFNQAMERASVEAALHNSAGLQGLIEWVNDATLIFQPQAALPPASSLTLTVDAGARSQRGLQMLAPVDIRYQTAGYLLLTQTLPEDGAVEVDPDSAVVAAFNYPVVPLGADPASLPAAFTLEPALAGRGEWVNTSTYIFYPELSLGGGVTYLARLNPELTSTDGSPLGESRTQWSFSVALPYPQTFEPADTTYDIPLDQVIQIVFNQSMDPQITEENFVLFDEQMLPVEGTFGWDEKFTTLWFTPTVLLERDATYIAHLLPGAASAAGQPLDVSYQAAWITVPDFFITNTEPQPGGTKQVYSFVSVWFSSYLAEGDLDQYITVTPEVSNPYIYLDYSDKKKIYLGGDFQPETQYTVRIDASLQDQWGASLSQPYEFSFFCGPLDPAVYISAGQDTLFLTPQDRGLPAQVSNLDNIPLNLGSLPLDDFFRMISTDGYLVRQDYQPADATQWSVPVNARGDRILPVTLPLSPDGSALDPGLYFLRLPLPNYYMGPYLLVVSNIQVTLKVSSNDAFVWAVDLRTNTPVAGVPVAIYLETGLLLANGETDAEGVFRSPIPAHQEEYPTTLAILGEPGDENFSIASTDWNMMISPYNFGYSLDDRAPRTETYIYTDRPIYRPGQTVYYRLVASVEKNGRYFSPDQTELEVKVVNSAGSELSAYTLPLSDLGTASGKYTLSPNAQPGYYSLSAGEDSLLFMVAEYRKPEIDLAVSLEPEVLRYAKNLSAQVDAQYFFGAPASGVPVDWNLYVRSERLYLPGYRVGQEDRSWLLAYRYPGYFYGGFGYGIASGRSITGEDGRVKLDLPTTFDMAYYNPLSPLIYTLEVTATDESGQPVSARAEVTVHREDFYIGIRPDAWVAQRDQETGFQIRVVDWDGDPAGERALHAEYRKVEWTWPKNDDPYAMPEGVAEYTPVASLDFVTSSDGTTRVAFTPPEPGTYELMISSGDAATTLTQWVGGAGQPVWPNQPNQKIELTADREAYLAGETAQVFVPNPFGQPVLALVTLERDLVLQYQVITLPVDGITLPFDLTTEHAPNVYLSVQLLGNTPSGAPDFRVGYLNLAVAPEELVLDVDLSVEPARAGPGDEVTVRLRVTDSTGAPVKGEFSLAVVDLAVLRLLDPFAKDITEWFYGTQPLGVRMGMSLAAYAARELWVPGGLGGGGGDDVTAARQKFPDTAYWNPSILTDANGEATLTLTLPDSLTTWQLDLRGITADHRVGQATAQIITSQDLLVRPITPRFLVAGDRVQLAAVVQNNTTSDLPVEVVLQGEGLVLEGAASQSLSVPANGRVRVEWWGRVQDVAQLDLLFRARSGDLQDLTQPSEGAIPVLRYRAPQAFTTAGVLEAAGEKLELVSLPSGTDLSSNARAGGLRLQLAPSLGAAAIDALVVLDNQTSYCTEFTLSRLLGNLATWQIVQSANLDDPALKEELYQAINESMSLLVSRQGFDGGWGWRENENSDLHITTYAVLALVQAQQAGFSVNEYTLPRAVEYLQTIQISPSPTQQGWELDRQAFVAYVRRLAGSEDLLGAQDLYTERARLSAWGQALLALALEDLPPGSQASATMFSDLQSTALRSGSGASWEDVNRGHQNMSTALSTTAIVAYALVQHDPESALLPDALRYLMLNRQADGGWGSTYTTAWSLLALDAWVRATGELQASFSFGATLNSDSIFTSQAGAGALQSETVQIPLNHLYPQDPNALAIQRTEGAGRLYYTAILDVSRPVSEAAPLNRGLIVSRQFYLPGQTSPVQSAPAGELVTVRLRLVVPHDAYYVMLEDYIPAGAEVLNSSLKTSQQGFDDYGKPLQPTAEYDPADPFAEGWGWWLFGSPQIYDERITWMASYLPAGAYELTYRLTTLQAGQYQVLPAHASQLYFPDVQGSSAGASFEILP